MVKTLIGTATTDANGVATITYESAGVGDVNIIAEYESPKGTLMSKTYKIEDCDVYDTSTHNTTNENVNIPLINTTSAKVEFDLTKAESRSIAGIVLGDDLNNNFAMGIERSKFCFAARLNRKTVISGIIPEVGDLPDGTFHVIFTYNNGDITCTINNQTMTYNHTQPLTNLILYECNNDGSVSNLKIKRL